MKLRLSSTRAHFRGLFVSEDCAWRIQFLADLCGADRGPEEEPRVEVNYHLFSIKLTIAFVLKVVLNEEDAHVQSVTEYCAPPTGTERETFGSVWSNL